MELPLVHYLVQMPSCSVVQSSLHLNCTLHTQKQHLEKVKDVMLSRVCYVVEILMLWSNYRVSMIHFTSARAMDHKYMHKSSYHFQLECKLHYCRPVVLAVVFGQSLYSSILTWTAQCERAAQTPQASLHHWNWQGYTLLEDLHRLKRWLELC